jgi:pimeloyl-ACP methyl ester carboxylesterase
MYAVPVFPGVDLIPELKSLGSPTLVSYRDHDFIPGDSAEHIPQVIPNAHMVRLKPSGRCSYMECPMAIREQIDVFLRAR